MYQKSKLCDTVVSEVRRHLSEQYSTQLFQETLVLLQHLLMEVLSAIIKKPSKKE